MGESGSALAAGLSTPRLLPSTPGARRSPPDSTTPRTLAVLCTTSVTWALYVAVNQWLTRRGDEVFVRVEVLD